MDGRIGHGRRRAGRRWRAAALALLLAPALAVSAGDAAAQAADAEPSVEALRDAAAGGDAAALFRLADLHERGTGGVEHDLATAAAYLRLAAERGHPRPSTAWACSTPAGSACPRTRPRPTAG